MSDRPRPPSRALSARRLAALAALVVLALAGIGASAASVLGRWPRPPRWPEPVRPGTAVGDSTCLSCHREKASYEGTAHRLAMTLPSRETIRGSFRDDGDGGGGGGGNVLRTAAPDVYFRMHADSTGFYQTAVVGRAPDTTTHTERIAYVAGSGRKGQSFLYWSGDQLFQMPVSYWASPGAWLGSPGGGRVHVDPRASFGRTIAPRCFECHATWMDWIPDLSVANRFRPDSAILGITCERCHAAGREHVARERSMLRSMLRPVLRRVQAPAIVDPARLDRARQMDVCAQCHGGIGQPKLSPFTYVAGRRLEDYLHLIEPASGEPVDVHGNQAAALARSACFRASSMTCLTCHDVHRTQRDVRALSARCLTCHQERSCGLFPERGHALAGRCVDCHMPLQASARVVTDDLARRAARAEGRTHWIRVYPETAR
jgi:hypothetical protein